MKLAYAIHADIDPTVLAGARADVRDQVTEQVRAYLVEVLERSSVELRDAQVWARTTPERPSRMPVESIEPIDNGRFRVRVRVSDNRTTSRTFETRHAAEAWADQIDPVFLPDDCTASSTPGCSSWHPSGSGRDGGCSPNLVRRTDTEPP